MKYLFILIASFSLSSYSQNTEINELFLEVPLNESRDSIYNFLTKSDYFIKEKSKVTYSGNFPKVYSGIYSKPEFKYKTKNSDSINVQLTFGNATIEGEKESKKLLIFHSYNYFSNSKSANKIIKKIKKHISSLSKEKPYFYKNYRRDENDKEERYVGFSNKWYFKNNEDLDIELKFEEIKPNKKYLIELIYSRNE